MMEDPKIKRGVSFVLLTLAVFLIVEAMGELQSYRFIGTNPTAQSVITVNGKGEVVGVPDIATFSFSVTEESLVIPDAQKEAAQTVNDILSYLKQSGVAEKDITTSGYTLYPRYEYGTAGSAYPYPQGGRQKLAAYVVTESVTVKVRDLGNAGKILGGIGELGATDVSGLSFDFDKRTELVREARDKAIVDARAEATKLAQALGVRLVRVVSFNEGGGYPLYYAKADTTAYGMGGAATPQIPVGEDKITSSVSITYEVK